MSGKTRIFVITTNGSMSALELNKMNDFEWKERWTLSYCNKECNYYHRHISDMIQAYFHKELILSNIASKIERWDNVMKKSLKALNPKQDTSTANNRVSHGDLEGVGLFGGNQRERQRLNEDDFDALFDMVEEEVTEDPFDEFDFGDGEVVSENPFDDEGRVLPITYARTPSSRDNDIQLPF